MRIYLHFLVAIALILSGVSPACDFIAGKKSVIEICTSDGFIKTIEVAADMDPFSDSQQNDHQKSSHTKKQCEFCFAQDHQKAFGADIDVHHARKLIINETLKYRDTRVTSSQSLAFNPRAPPLSLS